MNAAVTPARHAGSAVVGYEGNCKSPAVRRANFGPMVKKRLLMFIWPTRACRNVMKKGRCAETSFTDKPMPGTSQISARAHGALRASAMQTWREVVAAA